MEERAHAKVNLFLRVLRWRDDGFHEIETLIAPITLCDRLQITPANGFQFRCNDPTLPATDDNLVVRAARLFFAETKCDANVAIALEKKIPHGAGLGGGSSDAAATLRGLNRFCEAKFSNEKLRQLATALGSDVPFFISETAAICRGRGEIVTPTTLATRFDLLLLKPQFGVAAGWAYSHWRNAQHISDASYHPRNFNEITLVNDLEWPVFEKFPFLAQLKMWLLEQSEVGAALMSGSGSTVFAVLRDKSGADKVSARARTELDSKLWTCACETW
jgi:4-diphosphocytidyl-2-C-methyl-D-erythritol kinase